jgi:hypothetical protein
MRRFRASILAFAQLAMLLAIAMRPGIARADLTIYDKDGWSLYTRGLVAAHYQLTLGDGDPSSMHGVVVGTPLSPQGAQDTRDNKLTLSRMRSGFVGTQLGFGINRRISETVRIESLIAINVFDISSNRGQSLPKAVDVREAWAAVHTPYGTFEFGRMMSIFGSASSAVVLLAYQFALGHPCFAAETTIGCGSSGAGALYPGFDAQMRYVTPRVGGLELRVAISDPVVGPGYVMTPLPRGDAEINYEVLSGSSFKLRVTGQGVAEQLERVEGTGLEKGNVWGVMGSAILTAGRLSLGGGGWTGAGIGTHVVVEASDAANPLAFDAQGELRQFRGFFGNIVYAFANGSAIAAGGGATFVRSTAADVGMGSGISVLARQSEFHVVLTHRIDALVLTAEYMRWMTKWYFGEKQNENFMGVGANYFW